jgi:hypothetical protein
MKRRVQASDEEPVKVVPREVRVITLDSIIERAWKAATRAALQAARGKPRGHEAWRAAEKAAWNDVRVDTQECMWLRAQADD